MTSDSVERDNPQRLWSMDSTECDTLGKIVTQRVGYFMKASDSVGYDTPGRLVTPQDTILPGDYSNSVECDTPVRLIRKIGKSRISQPPKLPICGLMRLKI